MKDPISLEEFKDPVVASDGKTYEFSALRSWVIRDKFRRSPLTMEVLRPEVFVNRDLCSHLGLVPRRPYRRVLYKALACGSLVVPLDTSHLKTPWITRLFSTLDLLSSQLEVKIPVYKEERDWYAASFPFAVPWLDRGLDFVKEFSLDRFVSNPSCLAAAMIRIGKKDWCSLETLVGSEEAEDSIGP